MLLHYLTVVFDQVYMIGLGSVISEILAFMIAGPFFEKFGINRTHMVFQGLSLVGGIIVITYGLDH